MIINNLWIRKEEESICGVTEEDKKAVSAFANKYKITESALQSYFVFSKLRSSSGKTNGKPSKCPEKDAMVYLYRDRRDRFECVDSLIRVCFLPFLLICSYMLRNYKMKMKI